MRPVLFLFLSVCLWSYAVFVAAQVRYLWLPNEMRTGRVAISGRRPIKAFKWLDRRGARAGRPLRSSAAGR